MISSVERKLLVAEAEAVIQAGSKSFRLASRLFDRETRQRAWLLYAWCRHCDDLSDGQSLGHGAHPPADPDARLALIRDCTARALTGERTGSVPFDALGLVAAECRIPRRYIDDHLEGYALDAGGWVPATEADMLRYCYHVAGAVGGMMAVIMGVDPDDEETLGRAADLGIAFQLANIARDICEDAAVGRRYLPDSWLIDLGLSADALGDPASRPGLALAGKRLAVLAEHYEASARIGARRLPFRSRWAVLAAAAIYGAIARKVADRGQAAWDRRTIIGKREKLGHVARAWRDARA